MKYAHTWNKEIRLFTTFQSWLMTFSVSINHKCLLFTQFSYF